ncbi:MAG: indole-3-glycerol phosphate synthase TrpC [Bacteroidota bacterium]
MNILDKIVEHKHKEIEKRKSQYPIELLEQSVFFDSETISLKEQIIREDKSGIIAEFKRKSPSKGLINGNANVKQVTTGYVQAGVSALSVLTDSEFFGGSYNDLAEARKHNNCPILRKDFIIDEYQIIGAKSIGADAILLIASILDKKKVKLLAEFAHSLNLEVLLEVHNKKELEVLSENIDLVGVNNRNLKDFSVDIDTSIKLSELIPSEYIKVSESGISDPKSIIELKKYGYQGFLIGENFMKTKDPARACEKFIWAVQKA